MPGETVRGSPRTPRRGHSGEARGHRRRCRTAAASPRDRAPRRPDAAAQPLPALPPQPSARATSSSAATSLPPLPGRGGPFASAASLGVGVGVGVGVSASPRLAPPGTRCSPPAPSRRAAGTDPRLRRTCPALFLAGTRQHSSHLNRTSRDRTGATSGGTGCSWHEATGRRRVPACSGGTNRQLAWQLRALPVLHASVSGRWHRL